MYFKGMVATRVKRKGFANFIRKIEGTADEVEPVDSSFEGLYTLYELYRDSGVSTVLWNVFQKELIKQGKTRLLFDCQRRYRDEN